MSILDEEVHMLGDMNVDDDRRIVLHIKLQIVEIFERVAHLLDPSLKRGLDLVVLLLGLEGHVLHGFYLQGSHPCAGVELQVLQSLLLAFHQVALHGLRQELYSAVDAFLHALLLYLLQSLQLSLVLVLLLKHDLVAQQAAGVVCVKEVDFDLSSAYPTILFLRLEEILVAIDACSIDDVVFLLAFLAVHNFLLLLGWNSQELAADLATTCRLLTDACAHGTCILRELLHATMRFFVPVYAFRTGIDIFTDPRVAVRTSPGAIAHHFLLL